MKSFKQFLRENPELLTHRPQRGSGNIFTSAAGYETNPPEEYNPERSMMVHMTSHFPLGGNLETLGTHTRIARETLHFTRNGPVGDHMWGKWSDSKFGIMIPENQISRRLLNHGSHDSFAFGNVALPTGTKISVNWGALEDHDRDHLQALTKSGSHQETIGKLNDGHEVDFNGRKVTFHGTQENEKTGDSIRRHLRAANITPVNIGDNYATGFADASSYKYHRRFEDVYGPIGFISSYYQRNNRSSNFKENPNVMKKFTPERFARASEGDHATTPFMDIDSNLSWTMARHPSQEENATTWEEKSKIRIAHSRADRDSEDGKDLQDTLRQISSDPERFHPTAYSSDESKAAIQRIMKKARSAHAGVHPDEIGPSFEDGKENRKNAIIKATEEIRRNRS